MVVAHSRGVRPSLPTSIYFWYFGRVKLATVLFKNKNSDGIGPDRGDSVGLTLPNITARNR